MNNGQVIPKAEETEGSQFSSTNPATMNDPASSSFVQNEIYDNGNEDVNSMDPQQSTEPADEGTTTTVQFIAVSATEHARMVSAGELPESVHGADVHMQIPGADAQRVRLIAVDSNGIPVVDSAILQAAAEQAGILFMLRKQNNRDEQISIDQAMQLSKMPNPPFITATTAAQVPQQKDDQLDTEEQNESDEEPNEQVDKNQKPRSLKLRVYSQKDSAPNQQQIMQDTANELLHAGNLTVSEEPQAQHQILDPNDESVYEFQEPPSGNLVVEPGAVQVLNTSLFGKPGGKRGADKSRDRRKIYQCRECAFYSHRHSNLIRHIKIHTDERPYKCHLCDRAFRTNTLLRNHINTHTGVKPYKCQHEGCTMAFVTSGELTRHTRYIHTHEKPFKCTLCDYASVEISKLRRHFRSHTGERPYTCEECGKAFADSFHLKRHRMSHTGEKPYECPHCHARFTQRGSVKMHIMQQHTKTAPKFQCDICKTLLGRKSDLNVHMRKQHAFQETPTQCRYCDELFHDRWSLMQHQRTHRNGARFRPDNAYESGMKAMEGGNGTGEYDASQWKVQYETIEMDSEPMEDMQQVTVYVEDDPNASQTSNGGTEVMTSSQEEEVASLEPETSATPNDEVYTSLDNVQDQPSGSATVVTA